MTNESDELICSIDIALYKINVFMNIINTQNRLQKNQSSTEIEYYLIQKNIIFYN